MSGTGSRPLAFGDGVISLRAFRAPSTRRNPDALAELAGVVLEADDHQVTVGWADGGCDTYRGMAARWCLRRMPGPVARMVLRPGLDATATEGAP